jgi:hypothetical protein
LQLPQTNPGFNNTPFKFTKYSNAYMLVYIRDADKDKVVCNVDEKDIAEHLQVRCITDIIGHIILLQEQTELSASYEFIDSMWEDMIRLENFSIYESFIYRKYLSTRAVWSGHNLFLNPLRSDKVEKGAGGKGEEKEG